MSTSTQSILRLHPEDNVVVAIKALEKHAAVPEENLTCREPIDAGHKVAARNIPKGETILKYGQVIGVALVDIHAGNHVHTQNMGMSHLEREHELDTTVQPAVRVSDSEQAMFEGFVRPDGKVGTRNFIGVMASSACSSSVVQFIARAFDDSALSAYPHVDGIVPITHAMGCGLADHGDAITYLRRTLTGWGRHPNFGGLVLVGLGCEVNQIDNLSQCMEITPGEMFDAVNIQDAGGTRKTVERGINAIKAMLPKADKARRQSVPASHLVVGLECGGSDALSGITANPALGYASDLVVQHGGTAILSETSEIYGAEQLLLQRAISPEVGAKLMERVHWWEDYTSRNGIELNNNPSPGNKAGGLTTILEKSMGAVAKSGSSPLMDVYGFAEPVTANGLVFMDTPGYDTVSVTGMIAGGANMVCFTTGRGSVFGSKPVPTLKLATNTAMFRCMEEDMDVNCGDIAEGKATVEEVGQLIFKAILETASGRKSKSEQLGFGDSEFSPWMLGATL